MNDYDDWPTKKEGFRLFGWTAAATAAFLVIMVLVVIGAGAFTYAWAPWKGKIEERSQTVGSGTYRIQAYEYYFDQCNAIKAAEQKIGSYKSDLNSTPPPSSDQAARDNAGILVQTNTWIDLVNEYNANADKEQTKGQFRDDRLPVHIDPSNLANGQETTCS